MSTVFSYFASAAAAFHVHVSACSYLSLPCVYLRSVLSPLHLACFLRLAPFSVLFICIPLSFTLLVTLLSFQAFCSSFLASRPIVRVSLISSSPTFFCRFGFYFVVSSLFISSFLSLLHFAIYFVLALPPGTFIYLFLSLLASLFIAVLSAF